MIKMVSQEWNFRGVLGAVFLVSLALPVVGALGQPGQGPGVRQGAQGRGPALERLCDRLDLTEEQQAAVAKLRESGQAERRAWREQMIRLRHELRGEMLKAAPSAAQIDKLSAEIGKLQASLRASRLKERAAFRALLTQEQRDKLPLPGMEGKRAGRTLKSRGGGRGHPHGHGCGGWHGGGFDWCAGAGPAGGCWQGRLGRGDDLRDVD